MGAAGSSADNALAEAFSVSLKRAIPPAGGRPTVHRARLALFGWLSFFNTHRRHSALGRLSPTEYETRWVQLVCKEPCCPIR
jgi:transposase InsO family protein